MARKLRILSNELSLIIADAVRASQVGGLEICGLLIDNGYFIELKQCRNKSKRGGSFSFYQRDVNLIERSVAVLGHEIIGTFHSHPLSIAEPSASDLEDAFDEEFMLIIDVMYQNAALWHIKNKGKRKINFELL